MKRLLGQVFGVLVLVLAVMWLFNQYQHSGKGCVVLGAAVAHADEDCLHQDATSGTWAEAQQQQLKMAGAKVTTGLLYTDSNGVTPTTITSGESGDAFDLAMTYLQVYSKSIIRGQVNQAAGHVEPKAAALMRNDGESYGVLVINNPKGPCAYASGQAATC